MNWSSSPSGTFRVELLRRPNNTASSFLKSVHIGFDNAGTSRWQTSVPPISRCESGLDGRQRGRRYLTPVGIERPSPLKGFEGLEQAEIGAWLLDVGLPEVGVVADTRRQSS